MGQVAWVRPASSALGTAGRPGRETVSAPAAGNIKLQRGNGREAAPKPSSSSNSDGRRYDSQSSSSSMLLIGGWAPDDKGETANAKWFSERLTRHNAAWAFSKGETFRTIASLELFATLLSVIAFNPLMKEGIESDLTLCGDTDNQGNASLASRMSTTKFPLVLVLMELSVQLMKRGARLQLRWLPREQNEEADALSNGQFHGFSDSNRIRIARDNFGDILFSKMLKAATKLELEIRQMKNKRPRAESSTKVVRKLPRQQKYGAKNPW